jgi:hypothetical protein
MKLRDHFTLRSYQRTHKDVHIEEAEHSKIRRETKSYLKSTQHRRAVERQLLENPQDEGLAEELARVEVSGTRIRRNAKTHKRRLKKLREQGLE